MKPEIFMDTSAIFSGIWSETGASRQVLRLAESELVILKVSSRVLNELESTLREKAPDVLGDVTLLLDAVNADVIKSGEIDPSVSIVKQVTYEPDAIILSSAIDEDVDWFLTYDRSDFLENNKLQEITDLRIGTSRDFLEWYRRTFESVED